MIASDLTLSLVCEAPLYLVYAIMIVLHTLRKLLEQFIMGSSKLISLRAAGWQ